jgi:Protein of unknown function (DUF2783)
MNQQMTEAEFETVYDELARAIDSLPPDQECGFMARLCLLLSHRLGDIEAVRTALNQALASGNVE